MQDSLLYEYAVLRYVPRVEREEFINIGLIMMCKRRRWIRIRCEINPERLQSLRSPHSSEHITQQLQLFSGVAEGKKSSGPMATLEVEERFRWLTAVKSASLQTSRPHPGLTADLDAEFDRLFATLVL